MNGYFLISGDKKFELQGETLIGRSDECDLKVDDGHPSRRHATLTIDAEGAWLEDLGSANGTYVNEQRITTRTSLKSGDRINFDTAGYEFEAPASAADLGEATFVRSIPVDDGATVVRPIPTAPRPAPEPPATAIVHSSRLLIQKRCCASCLQSVIRSIVLLPILLLRRISETLDG